MFAVPWRRSLLLPKRPQLRLDPDELGLRRNRPWRLQDEHGNCQHEGQQDPDCQSEDVEPVCFIASNEVFRLPEWQAEHPVLCVAGRSLIDEAAGIMLAHLSTTHGRARYEGAEALSTTNIFRLDTSGVAAVCLVYLDAEAPAHMRYSVRRLRRKLPKATIILVVGSRKSTLPRWNLCEKVQKRILWLRA